jgi:hypothetical protein
MQDAPAAPPLPDDAPTLKRLVGELLDALRDQRRENEQLRSRLDQLLRRIYGPRSERINPDQPLLFDAVPGELTPAAAPPVEPMAQLQRNGRHGRRTLPKDLPRQRVEYDLSAAEKPCPDCGEVRIRFGEDRSERLD